MINCSKCIDDEHLSFFKALSLGPKKATIAFIGRSPILPGTDGRMLYTNDYGQKLAQSLSNIGLNMRKCYLTNVVKCAPLSQLHPSKDSYLRCCKEILYPELQELKNLKLIVTLGSQALKCFHPKAILSNCHGVSKLYTCQYGSDKQWIIFPTFQPSQALKSERFDHLFNYDIQLLKGVIANAELC